MTKSEKEKYAIAAILGAIILIFLEELYTQNKNKHSKNFFYTALLGGIIGICIYEHNKNNKTTKNKKQNYNQYFDTNNLIAYNGSDALKFYYPKKNILELQNDDNTDLYFGSNTIINWLLNNSDEIIDYMKDIQIWDLQTITYKFENYFNDKYASDSLIIYNEEEAGIYLNILIKHNLMKSFCQNIDSIYEACLNLKDRSSITDLIIDYFVNTNNLAIFINLNDLVNQIVDWIIVRREILQLTDDIEVIKKSILKKITNYGKKIIVFDQTITQLKKTVKSYANSKYEKNALIQIRKNIAYNKEEFKPYTFTNNKIVDDFISKISNEDITRIVNRIPNETILNMINNNDKNYFNITMSQKTQYLKSFSNILGIIGNASNVANAINNYLNNEINFIDIIPLPFVDILFSKIVNDLYNEIEDMHNKTFIENLNWTQISSRNNKLFKYFFVEYTSQKGKRNFYNNPTSFIIKSQDLAMDVFGENNIPLYINYNNFYEGNIFPQYQTSINLL